MAFKIIEEEEQLSVESIFTVIYGEPGTGKTSLSFTAENPLLLDFDQGVQRSIGRKKTVKFDNFEDVELFIKGGTLDQIKPNTIIIDTVGTLLDDYTAGYCMKQNDANKKRGGGMSLQGYGAMKDVFNDSIVRELKSRKIDIICICHVSEKESDGIRVARPKMTGGSYDILVSKADLIGFMYADSGKTWLDFNPTQNWIGKNCAQFPKIEIKNAITDEGFKTQMADIISKTKEHMSRQTEAQSNALKKVDEYREKILSTMDISSLTEIANSLDLPKIIELQIKGMIAERIENIFVEAYVEKSENFQDFNKCIIELKNQVPTAMQKKMFFLIDKKAKEKGLAYNKDKQSYEVVDKPE